MKFIALLFCLIVGATSGAYACPSVSLEGREIYSSATELWDRQSFYVMAGGSDASYCDIYTRGGERVSGYFADAPDFELNYSQNASYSLVLNTEGNCDSLLLINTGAGNWYFDDDDGGNYNARIDLSTPSDGWYDIWVGTVGSSPCDATLHLETFN